MQIRTNEIIGSLDTGVEGTRIDVILCQSEGEEIIALQLSTWHETLGWQSQKTIPLALEKLGKLQRLLSQTRNVIEDRRLLPGALAKVIEIGARGMSSQAVMPSSQPTAQMPATQLEEQVKSAIN